MTIDKIQFTHSAYVQWVKRATHSNTIVKNGWWAYLIGEMLRQHCKQQSVAAFATMVELGFENFTPDCWTMAGEMILANEQIEI